MARKRKLSAAVIRRMILVTVILLVAAVTFYLIAADSKWDGKRRYTVILDGDPLVLFSSQPGNFDATILLIPGDTMLEVPFGYNQYNAQSVFKLGNLDRKRGGGMLLSKSIENTFGILTDGFIAQKSNDKYTLLQNASQLGQIKKTYFSIWTILTRFYKIPFFFQNIQTNISFSDLIKLWMAVRGLRLDQISLMDLSESPVLKSDILPDQTSVNLVDEELFDQLFISKFHDQNIRLQNAAIEVVNATAQDGIASKFSRILQHLGGNVVAKTSTTVSDTKFNCIIEIGKKEYASSMIVKRLVDYYKCSIKQAENTGVADIKVILGEDFLN